MRRFDLTDRLNMSQDQVMAEICQNLAEFCYLFKEKEFSELSATQRKDLTRNSVVFAGFAKLYRARNHCPRCGAICNYLQGGQICQCFKEHHDKKTIETAKPE